MIEFDEMLKTRAFRDLSWAGALQDRMKERGLCDSGRLLSPVLRPCFLERKQADHLAEACSRVAKLICRLETAFADSPEMMQRLRMLPAEKVLAAKECDGPRSSFSCSLETVVQNGTVQICGIETCGPLGLGYCRELTELFDQSPVVTSVREAGYNVTPLAQTSALLPAVRKLCREQSGTKAPRIAIVEGNTRAAQAGGEGRMIAGLLSGNGSIARVCAPEHLIYSKGALKIGNDSVDVVFRRFSARDVLMQSDLSHPLLRAYSEGAACFVNSFKSEVVRRRALFDWLTDGSSANGLSAEESETVRQYIPWTRVLSKRRSSFMNQEIDLVPFSMTNRNEFMLRPIEDTAEKQTYTGCDCTEKIWARALQSAAPGSWVLHALRPVCAPFPVMQYGDLQMKPLHVTIHAHVIQGELRSAIAQLSLASEGCARPVALTPVFVVEQQVV